MPYDPLHPPSQFLKNVPTLCFSGTDLIRFQPVSLTAVTLNKVSFMCLIFALTVISPGWKGQNFNFGLPSGRPDSSVGQGSACNAGDPSLIPGLGRSPGEGRGCPLQYSGLENSMDCIVHGVAKSHCHFQWGKHLLC